MAHEVKMTMTAGSTKVVRTMCPMNCHPTYCGMLVEVAGGRPKTVTRSRSSVVCEVDRSDWATAWLAIFSASWVAVVP